MTRYTLAVDFDGVINPYSKGWQGGLLYEEQCTPGWWEWLERVKPHYEVVIHSSRFSNPGGMRAVVDWLRAAYEREHPGERCPFIKMSSTKPPAYLTIDDRCVRFDGDWDHMSLDMIDNFRPWTQR